MSGSERENIPDQGKDVAAVDSPAAHRAGRKALRGSAIRLAAYSAGVLLSLLSVNVMIDRIGISAFGYYSIVLSLVTIVAGFAEGGLNGVLLREISLLGRSRGAELLRSALGLRVIAGTVGVAIAVLFAAAVGYSDAMLIGVVAAGVGMTIQLLQSTLATVLQAELRLGWVSAIELVRQAASVSLIVLLALAGAGYVALLAVSIPAALIALLLTALMVTGRKGIRPSFHIGGLLRLIKEAIPWTLVAVLNTMYFRVALILLSLSTTARQTGYFATSFRIVEVLAGLPALLIGAALPILVRAERDDAARFGNASGRIIELSLISGALLVAGLESTAGLAIHLVASNHADPAIGVLRIQALALLATFAAVASGFPLLALRRYRALLAANLLAMLCSGSLTLFLAPTMGARGAAIGALVGEVGLAIAQTAMLARAVPRMQISARPIVGAIAGAAAAVASGLSATVNPILSGAIASAVYLAAIKLWGVFPPEVSEVVRGVFRDNQDQS